MKSFIEKHYAQLLEILKYGIVGGICVGIDSACFYLFHTFTGYRVALICGSSVGLIVNYFLNVIWTFKSKPTIKNAIGVLLAFLFNVFVVRFGLMRIFIGLCHMSESLAFVPTLAISVITNFLIVRYLINKF